MAVHPNRLARHIIHAAKQRKTITYGELGHATGVIARGLGRHLAELEKWCAEHKLPPLTLLVVKKQTGRPSDEGRYRGVRYGEMPDDEIQKHQASVFDHDWSRYGQLFDT